MNDTQNWQIARLDEIDRRGRMIPAREHLGIQAFGVNAFTPNEEGLLINEHDEAGSGQEALYVVLGGNQTSEIDVTTVETPSGSCLSVGPGARRKANGTGTVLVVGGTR